MASKYKPGEKYYSLESFIHDDSNIVFVIPWKRAHPKSFFMSWQLRLIYKWVVSKHLIVRAVKKPTKENNVKSTHEKTG